MARERRAQAIKHEVYPQRTPDMSAMVASARNMALPDQLARMKLKADTWQSEAWAYYDTVSEFRYAVGWVGNLLSKAKLIPLKDGEPTDDQVCLDAINGFFGGPAGQSEMFRQLGIHFTVAGEGWIFGTEGSLGDDWFVGASAVVTAGAGENDWKVGDETLSNPLAIRLWKPHPRERLKSDSPTRAVLAILAEIRGLTLHVQAQIESRLASAGILILPNEISIAQPKVVNSDGKTVTEKASANDIVTEMIRIAGEAIGDRGSASALVPAVFQVPGEFVDKVKHVTFWSGLDKEAKELRNEAIGRLGTGMDMPPEVLTGTADMNHWSSWQMEEAAIKSHTEPLLQVIADALDSGFFLPYLAANGVSDEDLAHYSLGVDTSELRLRPNRSKEASELYDRGVLSKEALMREMGFDPSDKMDDTERVLWLVSKVASNSSATPDMMLAALEQMGVKLNVISGSAGESTNTQGVVNQSRPDPSLKDHPVNEIPSGDSVTKGDPLTAAATVLVHRALELSGNRIRTRYNGPKLPGISKADTYKTVRPQENEIDAIMINVWRDAAQFVPDEVVKKLDSYTRNLLLTGDSLDTDTLQAHLEEK